MLARDQLLLAMIDAVAGDHACRMQRSSCYSSRAASALLFPAPAASSSLAAGSLLRFSKSSNFFEIHAKKPAAAAMHAGDCAPVYIPPLLPPGV